MRQNNLCKKCNKENLTNFKHCTNCLQKDKELKKQIRESRIKEDKCLRCGTKNILKETISEKRKTRICELCYFKNISMRRFGSSHRANEIKEILVKQNYKCAYSGVKITPGIDAQLDHIIARYAGGSDENENLQWVHSTVNRTKSDFSPEDFLNFVKLIYENKILNEKLDTTIT